MQMIPTAETEPPAGSTRERAFSPALGFAIALVVTVVLAVAVGVLVGTVAEDPEPDADFEWTQSGEGENLRITLEHAGGDSVDGSELTLEASGVRGFHGNTTLDEWGTVRNGSTLTVGFVADANVEGERINGTDTEDGTDVIAVAVEGTELETGVVLVTDEEYGQAIDVTIADLRTLRLTWRGSWSVAELDEYAVER